mmetsp:Transcript_29327/g.94025  ORF Transcript_29327/g.94025 Transcript_29327/m.94025 type:complete len:1386 (-) Transcript_29327:1106-5263(-)
MQDKSHRTYAKGCFIELDEVTDAGDWKTLYRWNYAVQEIMSSHSFSFPEASLEDLMDLCNSITPNSVILDVKGDSFSDVCKQAARRAMSGAGLSSRFEETMLNRKFSSKAVGKVEDWDDPTLTPDPDETALNINMLCSSQLTAKKFVLCRMLNPMMCFLDFPVPAKFCLFCMGPKESRPEILSQACSFAALMCDRNFRDIALQTPNTDALHYNFTRHLEDIVVIPHVHVHNSHAKVIMGTNTVSVETKEECEDVASAILEKIITDFDGKTTSTEVIHERAHQLDHESGFQEKNHCECFVSMCDIDSEHNRVIMHRWHNGLRQDTTKFQENWSKPHLPHVSVPFVLEAVQNLKEEHVLLDVPATKLATVYQMIGEQLMPQLQNHGMCEAEARGALLFLVTGGDDIHGDPFSRGLASYRSNASDTTHDDMDDAMSAHSGQWGGSVASSRAISASRMHPDGSIASGSPTPTASVPEHGRQSTLSKTRKSFSNLANLLSTTPPPSSDGRKTPMKKRESRSSFSKAVLRQKVLDYESELFLESETVWPRESMEVLCLHTPGLLVGKQAQVLVRLAAALPTQTGSPPMKWLYVVVGSEYDQESTFDMGRAVGTIFSSDEVFDVCEQAKHASKVLDRMQQFMRHVCLVPRAQAHNHLSRATARAKELGSRMSRRVLLMVKRKKTNKQLEKWTRRREELSNTAKFSENPITRFVAVLQQYSLPLLVGVVAALVFANASPEDYEYFVGTNHHGDKLVLIPDNPVFGHDITIHFLANDIFMVFFFGLAAKEVTESVLPGGSLNPIQRAFSPLLATVGGVVGPVLTYIISVWLFYLMGSFDDYTCDESDDAHGDDGHHRMLSAASEGCEDVTLEVLISGWGVPTATDISLAWMVASMVFGLGHAAIDFLLLLAVVDDGIGLMIIAVFYPDPEHPVKPMWLGLVPVAMLFAYALRRCNVMMWWPYILLCGPISWLGLLLAHVHPSLALVPIIPFMPSTDTAQVAADMEDRVSKNLHTMMRMESSTPRVVGPQPSPPKVSRAEPKTSRRSRTEAIAYDIMNNNSGEEIDSVQTEQDCVSPYLPNNVDRILQSISRQASGEMILGGPMDQFQLPPQPHRLPPLGVGQMDGVGEYKEGVDGVGRLRPLDIEAGGPCAGIPERPENTHDDDADDHHDHHNAPLHKFEHDMKLFVDLGLFFFSFANAGLEVSTVGGLTASIILALVVGKTVGIAGFAIFGDKFLGVPLPKGLDYKALFMVGFIASMGLTVALFVAGEAFVDPRLAAEAKMGALLSGLVGFVAVALGKSVCIFTQEDEEVNEHQIPEEFVVEKRLQKCVEEVDENVVREGFVRLLKKRHNAAVRKAEEQSGSPPRVTSMDNLSEIAAALEQIQAQDRRKSFYL